MLFGLRPNKAESTIPSFLPNVCLDLVGLVALVDLSAVLERTALTGRAIWSDVFILCPGMHRQQLATDLNKSEYPATAALTTGYVFRVENEATIYFLQKVGKAGHLTTLSVENASALHGNSSSEFMGLYGVIALLPPMALGILFIIDWWAVAVIGMLMTARLLNIVVIRARIASASWKGVLEPGIRGDLLVLLSRDRWIRMQGLVDDLKNVTSGQWLRDANFAETMTTSAATLLVYLAAALMINASKIGQIILLTLFVVSFSLLGLCNYSVDSLQMNGCTVRLKQQPVAYSRRLDLAHQLIKESGRKDWAIRLGMIVTEPKTGDEDEEPAWQEEVTM